MVPTSKIFMNRLSHVLFLLLLIHFIVMQFLTFIQVPRQVKCSFCICQADIGIFFFKGFLPQSLRSGLILFTE